MTLCGFSPCELAKFQHVPACFSSAKGDLEVGGGLTALRLLLTILNVPRQLCAGFELDFALK